MPARSRSRCSRPAIRSSSRSKLVLPGLIDTHRHTWETVTRSLISEGDLAVYLKLFFETLGPHYRPEDVYIGNLLGALGALSSGITTLLDWSHVMNTPAHADAARSPPCPEHTTLQHIAHKRFPQRQASELV
jgi:cytosine/adenosine deaminase-related metal-dependent hydrolase